VTTLVEEVASTNLITVDPQQDLDEALRLIRQHHVRRLPVVEEDGRLIGIVVESDVARHIDVERATRLREQIPERA
jgi:CBS domain-containing protein